MTLNLPTFEQVLALEPADARQLVGQLAALLAATATRSDMSGAAEREPVAVEGLLTVDEAAQLLRISKRWLYKHHHKLSFTRRVGRCLRFERTGLLRYCARRPPGSG